MESIIWFHCDKCKSDFSVMRKAVNSYLREHFEVRCTTDSSGERKGFEILKFEFAVCPHCKEMAMNRKKI